MRVLLLLLVLPLLASCGILNGASDGDLHSPFFPEGEEGEGEDGCVDDLDCEEDEVCDDDGDCVECVVDGDCLDDTLVCVDSECVEPAEGEGEGEEGEGEGEPEPCAADSDCGEFLSCRLADGTCHTITSDPVTILPSNNCDEFESYTLDRGGDLITGEAYIPDTLVSSIPQDKHIVVLLADDDHTTISWIGDPNNVICELYNAGYGVLTVRRFSEAEESFPLDYLAVGVRYLEQDLYSVPRNNISIIAGGEAANEVHALVGGPQPIALEKLLIVSAYQDFAPTPENVAAAPYPDGTHWIGSDTDGPYQCGSYMNDLFVEAEANALGWQFIHYADAGHGAQMFQSAESAGPGTPIEVLRLLFPNVN